MKLYIVVALIITEAFSIDQEFLSQTRARIKQVVEQCMEEENAQKSDVDAITNSTIPATHEGKCVLFCSHKKFNFQHDDGSINENGAMETFEVIKEVDLDFYNKVVAAYKHCLPTPSNADPCEYAAALAICYIKKSKEEGIHELIME